MAFKGIKRRKTGKRDLTLAEIRKKLGVTQGQLSIMLNVSRSYVALAESGKRNLQSSSNTLLLNIYLQLHELETGKQASDRSPETKLFLNAEYRKKLPAMKALEQDCRNKIIRLKQEIAKMKEAARDAGHAIIVLTTLVNNARELGLPANKKDKQVAILHFLKEQAYEKLLTCWEPEQAKLDAKLEAISGEAKALRRYRVRVEREHNPFKK